MASFLQQELCDKAFATIRRLICAIQFAWRKGFLPEDSTAKQWHPRLGFLAGRSLAGTTLLDRRVHGKLPYEFYYQISLLWLDLPIFVQRLKNMLTDFVAAQADG